MRLIPIGARVGMSVPVRSACVDLPPLPSPTLQFTVFNDACFLARVLHEASPLQAVEGFPERGQGYVAVKPNGAEVWHMMPFPNNSISLVLC